MLKDDGGTFVVLAGPGTSLTIPGIVVSEIASSLSSMMAVRRIEVDLGVDKTMGINRAPSLAAAHDSSARSDRDRHRAPRSTRARLKSFQQWIDPQAKFAIAYAWPGIDNDWIPGFLEVAKAARVPTVVLCASLPASRGARAVSLVSNIRKADRVLVGDTSEAVELVAAFGSKGPHVQAHGALSLTGRRRPHGPQQLTAFLPSEGGESLNALLTAFDAIPEARIKNFSLRVIMRHKGKIAKSMVADSYHAQSVRLFGDEMNVGELQKLCETSSALSMVDPDMDSRAFSAAVRSGVATVVLSNSAEAPVVGRGYVGGLMADVRRPTSIHVAMRHALRLEELGFPNPEAWRNLADSLLQMPGNTNQNQITRTPKNADTRARVSELVRQSHSGAERG